MVLTSSSHSADLFISRSKLLHLTKLTSSSLEKYFFMFQSKLLQVSEFVSSCFGNDFFILLKGIKNPLRKIQRGVFFIQKISIIQ